MAEPQKLVHRYIKSPTLVPYRPAASPTQGEICWVAGADVIGDINGWMERRPGWSANFETTPTTFPAGSTIQRLFAWRKWAASFYLMANQITATQSIVNKYQIGTDTSFVSLFTSVSTEPFDFVFLNNTLYFANGTNNRKWDGLAAATQLWGIVPPTLLITATAYDVGTLDGLVGYRYVYCFKNSNTGHLSSPSPVHLEIGQIATLAIVNGGSGWTVNDVIIVVQGINATATARATGVAAGVLTAATVDNPGEGYYTSPSPLVGLLKDGGGATATANITAINPADIQPGAFTDKIVEWVGEGSSDPQVDRIVIFRTVDGGEGIYFFLQEIANPGTAVVGAPSFDAPIGGALDDMTTSGTYTGSIRLNYYVEIDGTGTPNTFKWSNSGGNVFNAVGVAITGAAQVLADGVTITFGATTGHTLASVWRFSNWHISDNRDDVDLGSARAPVHGVNDLPPAMKGIVFYANRIWGFNNDTVFFSAFEEMDNGVEEEGFPPGNTFRYSSEVTGLAPVESGLLVYTAGTIHKITGDSLDTFRTAPLFERMGVRQRATITPVGKAVAWLDSMNLVRISDGFTQDEISKDIRTEISAISHAQAAMAFHYDGRRAHLLLLDGGASKIRPLDMDANVWRPPWSVGGRTIASVETSEGAWQLLLGHTSRKVLSNPGNTYTDNAATYAPTLKTNLFSVTNSDDPGHTGVMEYAMFETGSVEPAAVLALTDEDPATGTYVAITANVIDAPLRTQGSSILERWYYHRMPIARRISVRMDWANNSTNFKFFGLDMASMERQK